MIISQNQRRDYMMRPIYQCDVCGKRFTTDRSLAHNELPYDGNSAHPPGPNMSNYDLCGECVKKADHGAHDAD